MKQVATQAPTPPFMEKLIAFLSRYRKPIMITLGAIVVAIVVLVVIFSIQSRRNEAALIAVEDLQDRFDDWMDGGPEERIAEYAPLSTAAHEITEAYSRTYAASRARMIDAQALVELERWSEAASRFAEIPDLFPDSYLAPVALMNAAYAAETGGDTDDALALMRRLVDEYGEESPSAPRALFSVGRILEQQDNVEEAARAYRQLIDNYPASSWTNLARNRIITLTVEGRIGG